MICCGISYETIQLHKAYKHIWVLARFMNEEQIRHLLTNFKISEHYKKWRPLRIERHRHNSIWISHEKVKAIPDDTLNDLKTEFLEYYGGGEGRQVLNQIWRDRIIRDTPKFRDMLVHLLDESVPMRERFSNVVSGNGNKHIDGIGRAFASAFLMDSNLQNYCIWNNKTEMGLSVLGWDIPYQSSDDVGIKYIRILEELKKLKDDFGSELELDFDDVDIFLHWIAADEEGKNAIKNMVGESDLTEVGIYLEAPGERFIQQLIKPNFDSVFAPLSLKLYDADPDQTGAQFNTPIGIIDFLALDKNTGDFIVIELKIGKANEYAIGQILKYMGYVKEELAGDKHVRGIILAEDIDDKAKYTLTMVSSIEFRRYRLNFQLI